MLTWLLRNTKPKTSFIKVTGNGLGQNNLSPFCANVSEEEVAEYLKLFESTVLLIPNKEWETLKAEFLLSNSNANLAIMYVLEIPIRDFYHLTWKPAVLSVSTKIYHSQVL